MQRILVVGAVGQIGSELTLALRQRYGSENVVAGGHITLPRAELVKSGPFEVLDCTQIQTLLPIIKKYRIQTIYHMAAILSARAEEKPTQAWGVNIQGLLNILEIAREFGCSVFIPSSIGTFGPTTPMNNTPQNTIQRPQTIYGISKVAGELLGDFYFEKYGVDTRGVRYPGIISHVTLPGGRTTDFAVEIYYQAVLKKKYICYIKAGTHLDMMYMPDAIQAAISLMEADPARLKHRNAYNVSAMSLSPEKIAAEIQKFIPEFIMNYQIDPARQAIAEIWPNLMDDSAAREEWSWQPRFTLNAMTKDMLHALSTRLTGKNLTFPGNYG